MKISAILVAAAGSLLLAASSYATPQTYHSVSIAGIASIETPIILPAPFVSSTAALPIPVNNKLILTEVVAASNSGLTLKDLDIVMNDTTSAISVINKTLAPPATIGNPIATKGANVSDTLPVVTQNRKGSTRTYVESDYEFTLTIKPKGSNANPITINPIADVLFHEVFGADDSYTGSMLTFFSGGASGTPHFVFSGTVKTGKKTYSF